MSNNKQTTEPMVISKTSSTHTAQGIYVEHLKKDKTMSNNKTNPNDAINSIVETSTDPYGGSRMECITAGLTKREYFAVLALQGTCANQNYNATQELHFTNAAQDAVKQADALIKTLNNEQQ